MTDAIIFDIDGTMANNAHRLKHILKGRVHKEFTPPDWDAFHAGVHLDEPIAPIILLCRALLLGSVPVIFLTGRMEKSRRKTQAWLAKHLDYGAPHMFHDGQGALAGKSLALYMRGDDDFRDDFVVKEEILERIIAETALRPVLAFEDRPRVSAMWRKRGLAVAHVGAWLVEEPTPKTKEPEVPYRVRLECDGR